MNRGAEVLPATEDIRKKIKGCEESFRKVKDKIVDSHSYVEIRRE